MDKRGGGWRLAAVKSIRVSGWQLPARWAVTTFGLRELELEVYSVLNKHYTFAPHSDIARQQHLAYLNIRNIHNTHRLCRATT